MLNPARSRIRCQRQPRRSATPAAIARPLASAISSDPPLENSGGSCLVAHQMNAASETAEIASPSSSRNRILVM